MTRKADNVGQRTRRLWTLASVLFLVLAGCETANNPVSHLLGESDRVVTGSTSAISTRESAIASTTKWAKAWQKRPGDAATSLRYAASLRSLGSNSKALAVLREAAMKNPNNKTLLTEYGKQLAVMGQLQSAQEMLQKAMALGDPDWKLLSAQGTVLDKMGYQERAREYYASALKASPNQPDVLNNLGMSYALSGKLKEAESALRRAFSQQGASARTRQNLALVLGLSGRFDEAREIASADLPKAQVEANMAYLKRMMSQRDMWSAVKKANREGS